MDSLISLTRNFFNLFKKSSPDQTATIQGISGKQYVRGTKTHTDASYQYATSTHKIDHDMNPALVIQPRNKDDIKLALKYAKANKIAVAIRTGGHQYSGASSTGGKNIQLDLERTFQGPDDRKIFIKDGVTLVRTSVSWPLGSFNAWLTERGLFIPHGQCTEVHLGGHVQTGGYGQLARSFGLFGDHVRIIEMIDHNGTEISVTRDTDPDLFFAILGGSPGNFGIITHLTLEVHRDRDHIGSRGLKALYLYNPRTLKRLTDILVKMSDDPDFPPNYDLCVSVLSSSFKLFDLWPELDGQMREEHPEVYGEDGMPLGWPRTIVVYAQWVPLKEGDVCDKSFFSQFDQDKLFGWVEQKAMSKLTGDWIFRSVREFDHPYVKRTYTTNSTNLQGQGWSEWVTKRIDAIVEPEANRCWLSVQLQAYGGKRSRFHINKDNGTSYSWRDTTVVAVLDCFHNQAAKVTAVDWQRGNDQEGIGPTGTFSREDRRVLWGSYGDFNLDNVWDKYYESQEKYNRLKEVRKRMDPDGLFTPNTFCVKRA